MDFGNFFSTSFYFVSVVFLSLDIFQENSTTLVITVAIHYKHSISTHNELGGVVDMFYFAQ